MGKKSRSKKEKEVFYDKPSGKQELEKIEKRRDKKPEKKKEGLFSQYSLNKLALIEDIALAVLFFSVALIFTTKIQVHFTLPKLAALRISSFFIVLIWMYRIKIGEIRAVPKPILFTGIALGLWWIISTFFALHIPTALHGVYGRYNALLNHEIYLLLFFIVASMPMDLKRIERILKMFIAAFIPVSLYAILQFHQLDFIPWPTGRSASTIGNPVILGTVLGLVLPFVFTFFLKSFASGIRHWSIYCWGIILVIFVYASFSTLSKGPWGGMFCSTLIILTGNIIKKNIDIKKLLIVVAVFCLFGIAVFSVNHEKTWRIIESFKLYTSQKQDDSLQSRLLFYRAAISSIKDHPIAGVGFESYRIIYPKYKAIEHNLYYDYYKDVIPTMVHNGYLQTALTNGIPGLLIYLLFVFMVLLLLIRTYLKYSERNIVFLSTALIASITGYLIQDLLGWLEIAVSPFFWVLLGLGVTLSSAGNEKANITGWKKPAGYVFGTLCGMALIFLSVDAISRINADRLFWKSQMLNITKDWKQVESNIGEGLEYVSDDFYYYDMAGLLYIKRVNESGDREAYKNGVKALEKAHQLNPFDGYVLLHRIDLDSVAMRRGIISKPTEFAEQSISKTVSLDKNNPSVYESVMKLRLGEKRYKEALESLKKAETLRPNDLRYRLMEGEIYYNLGDTTSSMNAYKRVVSETEKTDPPPPEWAKAKYGIAYCLFNKRDFDSALKEMKTVTDRLPRDAHAYVIIGDAYGGMGNLEKAKESFATALKFDPNNQFAKRGYDQIDKMLGKR